MISPNSLAKNFSAQLIGRLLAVAIGLVSLGILTRSLTGTEFGEFTTVMTFLQMFGVVVDFGLTLTLVVMISRQGADEEKIVGNFLSLRFISGLIVFSIAPIAVLAFPWSGSIKTAVAVGAVAYLLMGVATMLVGVFQKHEAMWRVALAELLNRVVLLATIGLFAYLDFGVVAMVAASIVANFIWLISMIHLAHPYVKIRPRINLSIWKEAAILSWPIALSIIFNLLYLKGDILFLAYFREQVEVGIYGVSYRVLDVLTALPVMYMGLVLPSLVSAWSRKDLPTFRKSINKTFDLFMIAVIPVVVGAQVVGEGLTVLIAGDKYELSGTVLTLLIVAVIGVFLGALYGHAVVAINKQKQMIWGYAGVAVISIIGYLWLIPPYGMWGAVWVTLVSEGLIALLTFLMVYKVTRAIPNLLTTLKALLASGVMYYFLISITTINVLIDITFGALVYFGVMLLIRGIRPNEIKALFKQTT